MKPGGALSLSGMHQFLSIAFTQAQGTVNPLLLQAHLRRGLIQMGRLFDAGGGGGGISSPQRTRIQSVKAQLQEGWRSCCYGLE